MYRKVNSINDLPKDKVLLGVKEGFFVVEKETANNPQKLRKVIKEISENNK